MSSDDPLIKFSDKKTSMFLPRGIESILIVEDDWDFRELLAGSLGALGYNVLVGDSVHGSIDLLVKQCVSIMLINSVVFGVKGEKLVASAIMRQPSLKVLYMLEDENDINTEGVEYLIKPVTRGVLANKIRSILDDDDVTRGTIK